MYKNVIKYLRFNVEYVDVYVNYMAIFIHSGERCSKIMISVSGFRENMEHYACICFIPSLIIIVLDVSQE